MIPDEYLRIVIALWEKTTEDKLQWSIGSDTGEFHTSIGGYSIVLRKLTHDDGYPYGAYRISLHDSNGDELDGFDVSRPDHFFKETEELFTHARRCALHIDEAIMSIEASLGVKDSDGPASPDPGPDTSPSPRKGDDDGLPF